MEGMKQCPECQCTDVPIDAEVCPFCGHSFGRLQKAEPQNQPKTEPPVVQNRPKTEPAVAQNWSDAIPPVKKEEPVAPVTVTDKEGSKGDKAPAAPSSTGYKTYQKKGKKKHGFLKFLIVVAVLAFVCYRFSKSSGEEDRDIHSGGMSDIYSTSPGSTEPENQVADAGDGWMDESDEFPEMGFEEMPMDDPGEALQFILPLSDQVYLTRADIEGLSAEELRIARNEIYARHGRMFLDEGLQAYFDSCDWYVGSIAPEDFSDTVFNEYERANKDLIVSYEHELGVNGQ